jgi:hypothetical protein
LATTGVQTSTGLLAFTILLTTTGVHTSTTVVSWSGLLTTIGLLATIVLQTSLVSWPPQVSRRLLISGFRYSPGHHRVSYPGHHWSPELTDFQTFTDFLVTTILLAITGRLAPQMSIPPTLVAWLLLFSWSPPVFRLISWLSLFSWPSPLSWPVKVFIPQLVS